MNTNRKLYFVTSVVIFNWIQIGFVFGWFSPIKDRLETEYFLTESENSWLASVILITNAVGTTLTAVSSRFIGRKYLILCATLLYLVSWTTILIEVKFELLLISRIAAGLGVGISSIVVPLYISEIAKDSIRGKLSLIMYSSANIGTFLMYLIGPILTVKQTALIAAVPLFYTLLFLYYIAESPFFHILKSDYEKAANCLQQLRCEKATSLQTEFETLKESYLSQKYANKQKQKHGSLLAIVQEVFGPENRKALLIILVLFSGQSFSGGYLYSVVPHLIFQQADGLFSPNLSSLIFSAVQFLTAFSSSLFVDSVGRKPLLIASCFGCAFATFSQFMYFFLKAHQSILLDYLSWLPLLNAVFLQIFTSIGLTPIPTIYLFEIFPAHLKAIYGCIISIFISLLMFAIAKSFFFLIKFYPISNFFFAFFISNTVTGLFVLFFVPETKGKSFQEIQNQL